MDYKKNFTDATKTTMKNGGKDIATKVVPVILGGIGSIIVGIINQDK